jgi:hypothetical protein
MPAVRTLAVTQNASVDGSVEFLGDWFDPAAQASDAALLAELHRQDAASDAFLVGRRTSEDLRSYWPGRADDPTGIGAYLDAVAEYVVSATLVQGRGRRLFPDGLALDLELVEAAHFGSGVTSARYRLR